MRRHLFHAAIFVMLCFLHIGVQASHIIGGEIIAKRVDNVSLTYEITVIGYVDGGSGFIIGGGVLDLGDGQVIEGPFEGVQENLTNNITKVTFSVTHTFKGPSAAGYILSYKEVGRNNGIININDGGSGQMDFYIETKLVIDPFLGSNDTPVLTNPPTLWGQGGKIYQTNPGAYDPDGDLLTYRIVKVKGMKDEVVRNYKFPNDPTFYADYENGNAQENGPPGFSMDKFTGKLTWDAPGDYSLEPGCDRGSTYNIAYAVEEWRNVMGIWKQMGYVIRDHIIEVDLCNENLAPMLPSFQDTCVYAGEQILKNVTASNPDGDPLGYRADGEPLELRNGAAYTSSETSLEFYWTPTCADVRDGPYTVYFRATDRRSTSLASISTQSIRVLGPDVLGIIIQDESPGTIKLSWDPYSCPNADSMEVWRKEGPYSGERCELVHPEDQDFQLIGKAPINQLAFTDNSISTENNSEDYTYHLKATFSSNRVDPDELYDLLTRVNEPGKSINIYPNPTNGTVFIQPNREVKRYQLYDIVGKMIRQGEVNTTGEINSFDLLDAGVYVLILMDRSEQIIVKERLIIR